MATKKKLEAEIMALDRVIQASYLKVKTLSRRIRQAQNSKLEQSVDNSARYRTDKRKVAQEFLAGVLSNAQEIVTNAIRDSGLDVQPWTLKDWGNVNLPNDAMPPEFIRIGKLNTYQLPGELPVLPAMLPLVKSNHVLVFHSRQQNVNSTKLLSSISWRIISATSPSNYRFLLLDTLDRGRSFASLLNLPEAIRGTKIYCQEREIEDILLKSVNEMEDIIQGRLREHFDTLEEYNIANPHTTIPYHFIVFTAFPEGFNDQAIKHLISIAHSGIRAGYYLIGGINRDETKEVKGHISKLMEQAACLSIERSGEVNWDDPLFAHINVDLDEPPTKDLSELISSLTGEALDGASTVIEFAQLNPTNSALRQRSSNFGLIAPIGRDENGGTFSIELGPAPDAFHILVGGRIHSGKTNFLHTLILSLCLNYSEEDLHLYLIDFKEGVEFHDYALHQLPHARAIVIEAEREFGLSVLEFLDAEMERRSEEFKTLGVNVVNFEDCRGRTAKPMPRIVAIFDEFVKLFEEDDNIADRAFQALLRIVQRSRAFGIHLVLAAQRPVGNFQNLNPIKSQISLRVAFKCNEPDDSILILGERNDKAAYLDGRGLACITYDPTLPEKTLQVRVGFVSRDDRKSNLDSIRKRYEPQKPKRRWNAIVFKKWESAFWRDSDQIGMVLEKQTPGIEPTFWLGQPIRLADDVSVTISSQEGENVLLVGANDRLSFQALVHSLLGLALTSNPARTEFIWLQAQNSFLNASEYLNFLKENLPHHMEICRSDDQMLVVNELLQRMEQRASSAGDSTKLYLFVPGLHRLAVFRNTNTPDDVQPSEKLEKLLRDGPQLGVHNFVWVDRYNALRNATSLDIMDAFVHRVVFHVDIDDSNTILGTSDASRLGVEKRLLYRNQSWEERAAEKIKPFDLPDLNRFHEIVEEVRHYWE